MKKILVGFLVLLSLSSAPVWADECEGSWLTDAAKSGDIDTLLRAKAKAGGCVIQYASEAIAVMALKKEIEKELKVDPSSPALKRLVEVARKEALLKGKRALEFDQIQKIFNALINVEVAKKILEQSKKPEIAI